eukprot:gene12511-15724_t
MWPAGSGSTTECGSGFDVDDPAEDPAGWCLLTTFVFMPSDGVLPMLHDSLGVEQQNELVHERPSMLEATLGGFTSEFANGRAGTKKLLVTKDLLTERFFDVNMTSGFKESLRDDAVALLHQFPGFPTPFRVSTRKDGKAGEGGSRISTLSGLLWPSSGTRNVYGKRPPNNAAASVHGTCQWRVSTGRRGALERSS